MSESWSIRDWEESQMDDARLSGETRAAVRRLLDAWLNGTGPARVDTAVAFETFAKLACGEALVTQDNPDEVWQTVTRSGMVHPRDVVRVRLDAYKDEVGRNHNGRRGRVLAVRYGDVVVRYDDGRQPPFDGVHHPPLKLEKRVR